MTGSIDDPVAESDPGSSAACIEPPAVSAAGCERASSDTPTPPATLREFEQALRALGFSNRQAKAIARTGFRPAMAEADPEPAPDIDSLAAALHLRALALKGRP